MNPDVAAAVVAAGVFRQAVIAGSDREATCGCPALGERGRHVCVAAPDFRCNVEQLAAPLPALRTAAETITTVLPG